MGLIKGVRISFWVFAAGAVVLYVFFFALALTSPLETGAAGFIALALALLFTVRNLRMSGELADPGGNPALRRERNHIRERRGF
jgi:hypothetical protein